MCDPGFQAERRRRSGTGAGESVRRRRGFEGRTPPTTRPTDDHEVMRAACARAVGRLRLVWRADPDPGDRPAAEVVLADLSPACVGGQQGD
jgi:hypothetical protein